MQNYLEMKRTHRKQNGIYFSRPYDVMVKTDKWETQSSVVHTKKEKAQHSLWFPLKTTANYLGDWKEEKWDKKVSESKFFWGRNQKNWKKNHPAALINIIENKAVVLLWCVRCWSASPSACFPWLHHDSIANTLLHTVAPHSLHLRHYFLLLKKRRKIKCKKTPH